MYVLFSIEGEEYRVDFPAGYEYVNKRVGFKNERPGLYGTNPHGKERWFRGKMTRYMK